MAELDDEAMRELVRLTTPRVAASDEPRCSNCGEPVPWQDRHYTGMGNEILLEYWLCDGETARRYQARMKELGIKTPGDRPPHWGTRSSDGFGGW